MFEIIESLLFNIQYKIYLYEEINNNIIKQFIIILSIKHVKLSIYILYSLKIWPKSILPPTSSLYWKILLSKYKESNCIY